MRWAPAPVRHQGAPIVRGDHSRLGELDIAQAARCNPCYLTCISAKPLAPSGRENIILVTATMNGAVTKRYGQSGNIRRRSCAQRFFS